MTFKNLVWFRENLRLSDNEALIEALKEGQALCVYILDDTLIPKWSYGSAKRWWLHYSLKELKRALDELNIPLVFAKGKTEDVFQSLFKQYSFKKVFYQKSYCKTVISLEKHLEKHFSDCLFSGCAGALLAPPSSIMTQQGTPYKVFTPFSRVIKEYVEFVKPLPKPTKAFTSKPKVFSLSLEELGLLPQGFDWSCKFNWEIGELAAKKKLSDFLKKKLSNYAEGRDYPALEQTSYLSPHLSLGEISPRQIAWELRNLAIPLRDKFYTELIWRDFASYLLYHFPSLPKEPFNPKFRAFQWDKSSKRLLAWQKGETGYPLVDAGMRELWATGYMHNRVRMIVGSFLIKDLHLSWLEGQKWFWDTLVDADLANNSLGWQWIAGSGPDPAPFFRIFHPVTQSEKFDPEGEYIKRWIPELRGLDKKCIHKPWESERKIANYPPPIVDHKIEREESLKRFKALGEK